MSKGLKNMTLDELREGYEKGKVTDEEIEQHLLEQIQYEVQQSIQKVIYNEGMQDEDAPLWVRNDMTVLDRLQKLAEHEYQKLKDND